MSALGFDRFRTAGLMPLGSGLAVLNQLLLQSRATSSAFSQCAVMITPSFLASVQGLIHLAIIYAEEVFVREKNLEGS